MADRARQKWFTYDGHMRFLPSGTRVRHVPWDKVGTVQDGPRHDAIEELAVIFDGEPEAVCVVKTKSLLKLKTGTDG